jgi:hypothetical protein
VIPSTVCFIASIVFNPQCQIILLRATQQRERVQRAWRWSTGERDWLLLRIDDRLFAKSKLARIVSWTSSRERNRSLKPCHNYNIAHSYKKQYWTRKLSILFQSKSSPRQYFRTFIRLSNGITCSIWRDTRQLFLFVLFRRIEKDDYWPLFLSSTLPIFYRFSQNTKEQFSAYTLWSMNSRRWTYFNAFIALEIIDLTSHLVELGLCISESSFESDEIAENNSSWPVLRFQMGNSCHCFRCIHTLLMICIFSWELCISPLFRPVHSNTITKC